MSHLHTNQWLFHNTFRKTSVFFVIKFCVNELAGLYSELVNGLSPPIVIKVLLNIFIDHTFSECALIVVTNWSRLKSKNCIFPSARPLNKNDEFNFSKLNVEEPGAREYKNVPFI
ncbi:hypothetical protein BpHYR1_021525 [Brachionus plicatilis]|uniref:Uncharacterized protein n=1 Tax=Brachionus plicatilis TaxID=10195 RepID=A0A3M7SFC1_BRAPC|nr:hypothetical protein BpHYR1_021525 [Brachionus plicatilis]